MENMSEPGEYVSWFRVTIYKGVYFDINERSVEFNIDNYKCQICSARKGHAIRESDVLTIELSSFKTEEEAKDYVCNNFIPRFCFFLNSKGAFIEVTKVDRILMGTPMVIVPAYSSAKIDAQIIIPFDIRTESGLEFDEKARTALSFVNSALKLEKTPGAILLLIGALEALSKTNRRTDVEVSLIDSFIRCVEGDTTLTKDQKERMKNGLGGLKSEGSKSACRRVVELYGSKSGYSMSASEKRSRDCESRESAQTEAVIPAEELFEKCYQLRNGIIHGGSLPEDSFNYEIPLRTLVIDVLEGYLKDYKKQK